MVFGNWCLWLNTTFQSSCCSMHRCFIPYYGLILFHYMDIKPRVYPFIFWWTVGLFPPFGDCEQCCYKHLYASFCSKTCFQFFGYILRSEIGAQGYVSLFVRPPNCFPQQLYNFTFSWAMYDGSNFSTSLLTLVIFCRCCNSFLCLCFCLFLVVVIPVDVKWPNF